MNCTDINECQPNPCGAGTCTQGAPGTYSCGCPAGLIAARGTCVCDMTGTFALRASITFAWSGISSIQDGSDTTYSWAIRRQTYAADGTLTTEITGCGGTAVDLCGLGTPPVLPAEAYGQIRLDSRVAGCARMNGSSEIDCTSTLTTFMDNQGDLPITSASFVLFRAASSITCAQVRALAF